VSSIGKAVLLVLLGQQPIDGLSLQWDAPEECPGVQTVRDAFVRHAKGEHAPLTASGSVVHDGSGYVLSLTIDGPEGQDRRVVEAQSCDALADTAGLLLAVAAESMTEPLVVPPPTQPEDPAPAVEPPAPRDPAPEPRVATEPEPRAGRTETPVMPPEQTAPPVRGLVRVDGVVQALRLLPQIVGGGVEAAAGVAGRGWRAELRGQYVAPQPRDYADVVVGGRFDLWSLAAAGCWEPQWRRLSFPVCGGMALGSMRGRAESVETPGDASAFYAGLLADGAIVFAPVPRVGLRAGLGGVLSLRRPLFHVRDQETLFEAGLGALRGSLGVEVRFF